MLQEFLQALAIISEECGIQLIDAAVQLGADPATLHGMLQSCPCLLLTAQQLEWKKVVCKSQCICVLLLAVHLYICNIACSMILHHLIASASLHI